LIVKDLYVGARNAVEVKLNNGRGGQMKRMTSQLVVGAAAMLTWFSPGIARATVYNLHLGGMCSTHFNDGKGGSGIGTWSGETSINAYVDQRSTVSSAANSFKTSYLDVYCGAGNTCYIYNYSAGDNVMGYLFANYGDIWNIGYVYTTGGAGGGSALSGDIASTLTCSFANQLTESSARGMYNHNDTNAKTVYREAGEKTMLASSGACAAGSVLNFLTLGLVSTHCLSGSNDGAVEYGSAGAYVDNMNPGSYANYDHSDMWSEGSHWTGHISVWTPSTSYDEGEYLNHYELKRYAVCRDGGITGTSGYSACLSWADAQD
jgi:hypothetical protein